MQTFTFTQHFRELRHRIIIVVIWFIITFVYCYYYSSDIYNILLQPLASFTNSNGIRRIIYTGLTEAFFTYIKLAAVGGFVLTLPVIALQSYLFISPGLYKHEKKVAATIVFFVPLLFLSGGIFVFYYVMPRAWQFFLSFETDSTIIPIVLEAKIGEYLSLIIQLIIAFGVAFQLPIILLILNLMQVISSQSLRSKRRLAIVINFIIAAILTPPDVLSQFALAIPMMLLYELSIVMCKLLENRGDNARR